MDHNKYMESVADKEFMVLQEKARIEKEKAVQKDKLQKKFNFGGLGS